MSLGSGAALPCQCLANRMRAGNSSKHPSCGSWVFLFSFLDQTVFVFICLISPGAMPSGFTHVAASGRIVLFLTAE